MQSNKIHKYWKSFCRINGYQYEDLLELEVANCNEFDRSLFGHEYYIALVTHENCILEGEIADGTLENYYPAITLFVSRTPLEDNFLHIEIMRLDEFYE